MKQTSYPIGPCRGSDSGSNPDSGALFWTSFFDCSLINPVFLRVHSISLSIFDSRTEMRDSIVVI